MFDKIAKIVKCSKIIIDDRKAAYIATQHLIDTGCKRIAHFRGPLLPQNSIDRFLGYKKALIDNGTLLRSIFSLYMPMWRQKF
jgi:LacI family transcriptional regulator